MNKAPWDLKEVRNGKIVKPTMRFVRSLILVDALNIGRAQNSKTVSPPGHVGYIWRIVRARRPVF